MSGNRKLERSSKQMILLRVSGILLIIASLFPAINPVKISGLINKNAALITTVASRSALFSNFTRPIKKGWVLQSTLDRVYITALLLTICIILVLVGCAMSLGKVRLKRLGVKIMIVGSILGIPPLFLILPTYSEISQTTNPDRIEPMFPNGFWVFLIILVITAILGFINIIKLPKPIKEDKYEMQAPYKLFLMILPFVILSFLFSYLPLWGWRYSLFDYKPGMELTKENFVGFKWFTFLLKNPATRRDLIRVLKNTLAMSFLGIITSFLPMLFAMFLNEVKSSKTRKFIQTGTTIPNFISWILVYVVFFALFSTEGFVNAILIDLGIIEHGTNYLMSSDNIWLKMWATGTWKGLGWSAIIYIAGINSIDPQLYEAATIDGAGRFQRMRYITLPGLLPTFAVLLLLSIGNILSNGMDQYLVFRNPANTKTIEVLDLYVYNLGLGSGGSGNIPLATVVGMFKSLISIILLVTANKFVSKTQDREIF